MIWRLLALPLVALIRLYQRLISPHTGRRCMFRPTCSEYTVQQLRERGIAGLKKAWEQIRDCTGEYEIEEDSGRLVMITRSGRRVPEDRIAPYIVERYRAFQEGLNGLGNDKRDLEESGDGVARHRG